ncbi:DUF4277 domain-containing protein [Endozoicomonas sp. SCSIO W0465]|uniref:DUF4277 domain-containing protein n=1 Tax=Endozoicomonas sp. SCSIO W0465 TaxID=2918516 RepID=UPI002075279A|nr:DUF4277 domain-containing protein [Endozoicomonas sp. SCSIO W0465]USE34280.1 DUF4277 domain-containing protein [Endozoicomonas sp. SCSIO W0465]
MHPHQFHIQRIDHMGLVAGMCKELGISNHLDSLVPNQSEHRNMLMMTENQAGIPVFMKASSGNVNDNENFKKVISSHLKSYREALNNRYLIGDAALYTTYCQAEPVITEKPCYTKVGRSEKGSKPDSIEYYVSGYPWVSVGCRKDVECSLGCFVLATNDLDDSRLSTAEVLSTYKSQQSVERGFRFLKRPEFLVSLLFCNYSALSKGILQ